MRIDTYGQQLEVTPALRDYVESKLSRLSRHFDQPIDVRTQLSLDKPDHRAEANVNHRRPHAARRCRPPRTCMPRSTCSPTSSTAC